MLINRSSLAAVFTGFNAAFTKGYSGAPSAYRTVAMTIPSTTGEESYAWLGQFPKMREWIGPRVIQNLAAHTFSIVNRTFESTVSVKRAVIEDDRFGVFTPIMEEMGKSAGEHPDELVFQLLGTGFTTACYDGQNFFDSDHPVTVDASGTVVSVSNVQEGAGPAWYLLDCSRAVKPLIHQERIPYRLTQLTAEADDNVFWQDEYIYGVRARANAGFGLWQLAFASKAELTAENYEAARAAMMNFRGDEGRPLGIRPDVLVVPPELEGAAMRLLNNGTRVLQVAVAGGGTTAVAVQNEWAKTATPIVTPWVAAA